MFSSGGDFIYYQFTEGNILKTLNKLNYPFVEKLRVQQENSNNYTDYKITGRGIPVISGLEIVQNDGGKVNVKMLCTDLISNNLKRIEYYERNIDVSKGRLPPHKYIEVVFTIE